MTLPPGRYAVYTYTFSSIGAELMAYCDDEIAAEKCAARFRATGERAWVTDLDELRKGTAPE